MLFRSTGLGKTELTAKVVDMKRQGDYLILQVDTLEPVRWRIRAAFCFKDLLTVIRLMIKLPNLKFAAGPKNWFNKAAAHPGDF